ncbi:MAG: glycosyltransferase [Oscillospiraceae bacterium]|nr:glycosyltransferase [Oscillospiraceae bacterium]
MSRVFVISYRKCLGPVGGGTGVNFKLYLANKQYGMIDNCYHIFTDQVIAPGTAEVSYSKLGSAAKSQKKGVMALLTRMGAAWIAKHQNYRKRIRVYLRQLNEQYHFNGRDVFLFQDVESAHEFMDLYPFTKTVLIYHQQGSLYNEWQAFNFVELPAYRKYLNKYSEKVYQKVKVLAFPSMGAKDSLLQSEPYFEKVLGSRSIDVLYNGFTKPELPADSDLIQELRSKLESFEGYKFATVSALNEAKGVERIPQYLAEVGKKHPFRWVIVGNGVKAEELEANIAKYGIADSVIWIRDPMPHDDILKIFSMTDHYILFHRFSIFDYSTIEAMAYGNIPVLTPIGGNKEVIFGDNGVFVDDFSDTSPFEAQKKIPMAELKEKNMALQNQHFSDEAFLARYQALVERLKEGN